jgi:hypothetical protein
MRHQRGAGCNAFCACHLHLIFRLWHTWSLWLCFLIGHALVLWLLFLTIPSEHFALPSYDIGMTLLLLPEDVHMFMNMYMGIMDGEVCFKGVIHTVACWEVPSGQSLECRRRRTEGMERMAMSAAFTWRMAACGLL